jgi:hypothetical protein
VPRRTSPRTLAPPPPSPNPSAQRRRRRCLGPRRRPAPSPPRRPIGAVPELRFLVRSTPVQLVWVPVRRAVVFTVAGRAPPLCLAGRRRPSPPPPVRTACGFARARSSSQCASRASWCTPAPNSPCAAARRRAPPRRARRRPSRAAAPLAQLLDRWILIQRPRSRHAAGQAGCVPVNPTSRPH